MPKLFGKGLSLFDVDINLDIELKDVETIDRDYLLLKYSIIKDPFLRPRALSGCD
jgi:hypothetical protein